MTNNKSMDTRFDSLRFAECPIERGEPFFWRWTKHGRDVIKSFIRSEINATLDEVVREAEGMKKKMGVKDWGGDGETGRSTCPGCISCGQQEDCNCESYNATLSDLISKVTKIKK